jgi:hypothetical protein
VCVCVCVCVCVKMNSTNCAACHVSPGGSAERPPSVNHNDNAFHKNNLSRFYETIYHRRVSPMVNVRTPPPWCREEKHQEQGNLHNHTITYTEWLAQESHVSVNRNLYAAFKERLTAQWCSVCGTGCWNAQAVRYDYTVVLLCSQHRCHLPVGSFWGASLILG